MKKKQQVQDNKVKGVKRLKEEYDGGFMVFKQEVYDEHYYHHKYLCGEK